MSSSSNRLIRARCVDCHKIKRYGAGRIVWCDDCGGELRPIAGGTRRKVKRGFR